MLRSIQARSVLLLLILLLCLGAPLLRAQASEKKDRAEQAEELLSNAHQTQVVRILVMGCDASERLTDSIFILALNSASGEVGVVQIPRDTYADYTERDYKKINGAWSRLGPAEIRRFYASALGIPLDGFVILNLSDLRRMVDAVGGVDVEIPMDMDYSDPAQGLEIHLKQGRVHLDGRGAEHFVRYRSGYATADLGRLDAQKLFMEAFAERVQSLPKAQALRLLAASLTALQTDLPLPGILRIVSALEACSAESIRFVTLPGQAVQGSSGAWYYSLNREGALRVCEEYLFVDRLAESGRFDPEEIFDRKDHPRFHQIYLAPEEDLPLE